MCSGPSTTGCICKYPYFRDDKSGECVRKEDCQNLNKRENQFEPYALKMFSKAKTKYNKYPWGFSESYTITRAGEIFKLCNQK